MKKIITTVLVSLMVLVYFGASAQCTPNRADTTIGFSPTSLPCAQQGTAYGEAVQVHVPGSLSIATIDSLKLVSITGLPLGINYSVNPASGTIPGDSTGCIWFSGTTNAATGPYVLTVRIIAYTNFGAFDTTLNGLGYADTLSVCAPVSAGCDTISNLTSRDTLELYFYDGSFGLTGFLSGNNIFGDLEKAEEFNGPLGATLNGAFIGFGYASIISGDSATPVTINAYDGTSGSPGATFATTTVTMRQIAYAVTNQTDLYVSFPSSPVLPGHNFFISVVLPVTGDTVALLTNTQTALDGNGWEEWNDNTWHSYPSAYFTFPFLFGNDIAAQVCGGAPLAAFQSTLLNTCGSSLQVQFFNTSSNGATGVSWSFPGGSPSSSTQNNPSISYSGVGVYQVQLIGTGTGGADTFNSTVTLYPAVTGSISTTPASSGTAADGSVTATGITGTAPYSYFWSDANQDTSASVSGLTAGTYTVSIIDSIGCFAVDTAVVSIINAIVNVGANKVAHIYPNPANNVLNIDWNTATTADMSISDMSGRVVAVFTTENNVSGKFDIHGLAAGAYILTIKDRATGAEQSVRLVKE